MIEDVFARINRIKGETDLCSRSTQTLEISIIRAKWLSRWVRWKVRAPPSRQDKLKNPLHASYQHVKSTHSQVDFGRHGPSSNISTKTFWKVRMIVKFSTRSFCSSRIKHKIQDLYYRKSSWKGKLHTENTTPAKKRPAYGKLKQNCTEKKRLKNAQSDYADYAESDDEDTIGASWAHLYVHDWLPSRRAQHLHELMAGVTDVVHKEEVGAREGQE